ncbi:MAG: Rieske 2Fe-2S domain-containing protein [bacterium]|nr:Rieske 2Fe-2S domain-containing protein [bacterium]
MSDDLVRYRERSYPPPFPDGWYRVAASRDIKPGEVKHIQCLGTQIALFRGRNCGRIAAVDAFSPHLGANLAHGRVEGDQLQCSFHGWQVDGGGRIRDAACVEDRSLIHRHWKAIDYYGMVMIWWSARRSSEPPYLLPLQPRIDERQFVCRGQYDAGHIDMHIIEFAENSVDVAHFARLHGILRIPWTDMRLPWIKIRHKAAWFLDDTLAHVSYFGDEPTLEIGGRVLEKTRSRALITFLGPGSIVKFDFHVPGIGDIAMFQTHTPVEPLKQRVSFRWFAARRLPRTLVSYVIGNWISQWHQNVKIWQGKIYRRSPPGIAEDAPLGGMRAWYGQFYPDGRAERPCGACDHGD